MKIAEHPDRTLTEQLTGFRDPAGAVDAQGAQAKLLLVIEAEHFPACGEDGDVRALGLDGHDEVDDAVDDVLTVAAVSGMPRMPM